MPVQAQVKVWSSKKAARLIGKNPESWTSDEKRYFSKFFNICPSAVKAQKIALDFKMIIKQKSPELLDSWIEQTMQSDIEYLKRFAKGIKSDYEAVKAALTLVWSNGQVEGQINRLKTLKRQMYGRASFQLLRKKIMYRSG